MMDQAQEKPVLKRLFKKDCSRFKKYIQSASTAHGVVYIFKGKSYIRRTFWLLIVLICASACLYNVIDRISYLASGPTTTTIMLSRNQKIDFPAVTICNLNMLRKDYLESLGLREAAIEFLYSETGYDQENCGEWLARTTNLPNITYQEAFFKGKHDLESMIIGCQFLGYDCDIMEMFVPTLTQQGVCFAFSSGLEGAPVATTSGTGAGMGLRLIVNISQDQYAATPNLDAGVKISIHRQSDPPQPFDQGTAVPPGSSAFISIKQVDIIDKTHTDCNPEDDTSSFNFLHNELNYSSAACATDCFYTQIADSCGCIFSNRYPPDKPEYEDLPLCMITDACCVLSQQTVAMSCPCSPSCTTSNYDTSSSYSSFPAKLYAKRISSNNTNYQDNLLMVNIFYETLSITNEVTSNAYDAVSLLSDIGGQLGLFLGISVISVVEFAMWVLDEVKDRFLGISERRMREMCCRRRRRSHHQEMSNYSRPMLSDHEDS